MKRFITLLLFSIAFFNMAISQSGTKVTSSLVPNSFNDNYSTHQAKFGKGGYRSVKNTTERDAIFSNRRDTGMLVYVASEDKIYILKGGIANGNWDELKLGGATSTDTVAFTKNNVAITTAGYTYTFRSTGTNTNYSAFINTYDNTGNPVDARFTKANNSITVYPAINCKLDALIVLNSFSQGSGGGGESSVIDSSLLWTKYNESVLRTIVKDPTGFDNPANVTVSYNSTNRTVTLTGTFTAYFKGTAVTALTSGWTSSAHTATNGVWFLYYNGSEFVWSQTAWTFDMLQIASVYYQTTDKYALREPHGLMPWQAHKELHEVIGTYLAGGGDLSNYVLNSTTAANRRPFVSAANLYDEDLLTINAALNTNSYTIMYLTGVGSTNTFLTAQSDIVPLSTNRPYYNQFTSGAWQQTLLTANTYMNVWLIAIPVTSDVESQSYRYVWVQGQNNGTLSTIQSLTPSSINLGTLSNNTELLFIGRVILNYTGANWQIVQVNKLNGNRYNQTSNSQGNFLTGVTTDNTLTGIGTALSPLSISAKLIPSNNNTFSGEFDLSTRYRTTYSVYTLNTAITPTITSNNLIDSSCRLTIDAGASAQLVTTNMGSKLSGSDNFTTGKLNQITIFYWEEGLFYFIKILN